MEAHLFDNSVTETWRKHTCLDLQHALDEVGTRVTTDVQDQRKFDYALLPTELPVSIREKVTKILHEGKGKELALKTAVITKAPWQHLLEHHVARLMQQMRSQPEQFRILLLVAASVPRSDVVDSDSLTQTCVDAHKAYRRIRRAAMTLGEETFHMVHKIVRRSEINGVLPHAAHMIRLLSLYKLQLRQHVTIRAVVECIQQVYSGSSKLHDIKQVNFGVGSKAGNMHTLDRRQVKSATSYTERSRNRGSIFYTQASASAGAIVSNAQKSLDVESMSKKITSVYGFKLQALERLLSSTWQSKACIDIDTLSNETLAQIRERVTAFLYQNRDNFPLWDKPPLSREETARHLRTIVATLLKTPLLQNLTIEQLLEVAKAMKWQVVAPGKTFANPNTEMDTLFIVMDGAIVSSTASTPTSDSFSCTDKTISAPACFGELGMVRHNECWTQTLKAQSTRAVKLLALPKLTLETLLHRFFTTRKASSSSLITVNVQPRRPSSSSAGFARRSIKSKRQSIIARRPLTAVPVAAAKVNIERWHKVRDETLCDYRAGLEAEQRAAALEASQRAMTDLYSASIEGNNTGLRDSTTSPQESPHDDCDIAYPKALSDESTQLDTMLTSRDIINFSGLNKKDSACLQSDLDKEPITDLPNQLRDYYRALNKRRSTLKMQQAASAPPDSINQPIPSSQTTRMQIPIGKATSRTASILAGWAEKERSAGRNAATKDEFSDASKADTLECRSISNDLLSVEKSHSSAVTSSKFGTQSKSSDLSQKSDVICLIGELDPVVLEVANVDKTTPSFDQAGNDVAQVSLDCKSTLIKQKTLTTAVRNRKMSDENITRKDPTKKQTSHTLALLSSQPQSGSHDLKKSLPEMDQCHNHASDPHPVSLQQRMDHVLNELRLSSGLKLEIGLKYSHTDHYDRFPVAVQLWERVYQTVVERESVMTTLWDFEILASDPRRHFRSLSTRRLQEEKERDTLMSKLDQISASCLEAMDELWQNCGDNVYLGDRSYREKMKTDYTELLYQVEQERLHLIYNEVQPRIVPDSQSKFPRKNIAEAPTCLELRQPPINVSAVAPCRPSSRKDLNSPNQNRVKYENMTTSIPADSKDGRKISSIVVDGADADPTRTRFRLATPRESLFIPVGFHGDSSTPGDEQHRRKRGSQVTVQIQQQRQIELLAFTRQFKQQSNECSNLEEAMTGSQLIRQPEATAITTKKCKDIVARSQLHANRSSLKKLVQQIVTRSKK
ncbi:putative Coiled-coil domain-containing protein [Plasmopara halstedii]